MVYTIDMNALEKEKLLIDEIELLLAEKRTYYSLLRTGAAVFALPLSVFAFLWATLASTSFVENPYFYVPVGGILLAISLLGLSLMREGDIKTRAVNQKIGIIKQEDENVSDLVL